MFLHETPRAAFSALEKTNWIILKLFFFFQYFKSPLDIRPCSNPIAGWLIGNSSLRVQIQELGHEI